jgi:ribosomal protein eS8
MGAYSAPLRPLVLRVHAAAFCPAATHCQLTSLPTHAALSACFIPAAITRDSRHKRRATGGRRHPHQKKRQYETGRPPALTKMGPKRIHLVRGRGGNLKYRALRLETGNFSWGSESAYEWRALTASGRGNQRESREDAAVGCAVLMAAARSQPGVQPATAAAAAPGPGTQEPQTEARCVAALPRRLRNTRVSSAPISCHHAAPLAPRRAAVTRKTRILDVVYNASNNELVRTKTLVKNAVVMIDSTPFKTWMEAHYHTPKTAEKGKEGEAAAAAPAAKVSRSVAAKVTERTKGKAMDPKIEEQMATGRLLAVVSSRPGQSGRADGYILEGPELEFYQRKLALKKSGKKA